MVEQNPLSVWFLMGKGIRCLRCGEPICGTLKEAAIEKGYPENSIPGLIEELKDFIKWMFSALEFGEIN